MLRNEKETLKRSNCYYALLRTFQRRKFINCVNTYSISIKLWHDVGETYVPLSSLDYSRLSLSPSWWENFPKNSFRKTDLAIAELNCDVW